MKVLIDNRETGQIVTSDHSLLFVSSQSAATSSTSAVYTLALEYVSNEAHDCYAKAQEQFVQGLHSYVDRCQA